MKLFLTSAACALMAAACVSTTSEELAPAVASDPPIEEAAANSDMTLAEKAGAPLFDGMGDYHRDITTNNPDANRYFDQGMVLAFGFNHAEAIRSFSIEVVVAYPASHEASKAVALGLEARGLEGPLYRVLRPEVARQRDLGLPVGREERRLDAHAVLRAVRPLKFPPERLGLDVPVVAS